MSWKRTILKVSVFLGTLVLFGSMLLFILINSYPFQSWVTGKVTTYLSEQLKTPVHIGKIRFKPLHTLSIEDVLIGDVKRDTLIYVHSLNVNLRELNLENNLLVIEKVQIEKADVALRKYPGMRGLNIDYLINFFAGTDTTHNPNHKPFVIRVNRVVMNDSRFSYFDQRDPYKTKGFDESHIDLQHMNLDADNMHIIDDSIVLSVNHLSCIDRCGMRVKHMKADVIVSSTTIAFSNLLLQTPGSELKDEFKLTYEHWSDFNDFESLVTMEGNLDNGRVSTDEIGYFAEEMEGYHLQVNLDGRMRGPLNNLKGKKLKLSFGRESLFDGDLSMKGLPNIDETYIDLKINRVQTIESDLALLLRRIKMPREFSRLGQTSFKGRFTGFINDFVAYGELSSDLGQVKSDLNMKLDQNMAKSSYSGSITLNNFDVGTLTGQRKMLGLVSMDGTVKGRGLTLASVHAELESHFRQIRVLNYTYRNIDVAGQVENSFFTGNINAYDPNLRFDFAGAVDLRAQNKLFQFSLDLKQANLKALGLDTNETMLVATADIDVSTNKTFSENKGDIQIHDIMVQRDHKLIPLRDVSIVSEQKESSSSLSIRSPLVDLDMKGLFNFQQLPRAIYNLVSQQAGNMLPDVYTNVPDQYCSFDIRLKSSEPALNLFYPAIAFRQGQVKGNFNSKNGILELHANLDTFCYTNISVAGLKVDITKPAGSPMAYTLQTQTISLDSHQMVPNLRVGGVLKENTLTSNLVMNDNQLRNFLNLNTRTDFAPNNTVISLLRSKIVFRDKPFNMTDSGTVNFTDSGIAFSQVELYEGTQHLKINGLYSELNKQDLTVDVKDLKLDLVSYFLADSMLQFNGIANGTANFKIINGYPAIIASLKIKDASYLKDTIGNVVVTTSYESSQQRIGVDASIDNGKVRDLRVKGYLAMSGEQEVDMDVSFKAINLDLIEEQLSIIFSDMNGRLESNDLHITGTLHKPVVNGTIKLPNVSLSVGYLKTIYYTRAEIECRENMFTLKNTLLQDHRAKICKMSGWMSHDYFTDFKYKFRFDDLKEYWLLNTEFSDNSLFYGKAYGSGSVEVAGTFNKVKISANLKSTAGTKIFLPLSNAEEATESDFVRFISKDEWKAKRKTEVYKPKASGLTLDFDVELTPDAEVQLVFNSKTGDIIKGKGKSNLKMELTQEGDFLMYGGYTIVEGSYQFTALNVFTKRFVMEPGGTIYWNGDPLKARINMTAIYKLRTAIYPLVNLGEQGANQKRIPVECKLMLSNMLLNPDIKFDVNLPDLNNLSGSSSALTEVGAAITQVKSNVDETNRQFFSLLMTGSFFPLNNASSGSASASAPNNALNQSVGDFASNQLSNILSQIDPNWEVNVNYQAGDVNKRGAIISITRRFMNDRLEVQSSSDVLRSDLNLNFQAKYDLTKDGRLKLKAFNTNTTNPVYSTQNNSQNVLTQGLGLYYSRQFNKLSDLKRKEKRKTRKQRKAEEEKLQQQQKTDDNSYPEDPKDKNQNNSQPYNENDK